MGNLAHGTEYTWWLEDAYTDDNALIRSATWPNWLGSRLYRVPIAFLLALPGRCALPFGRPDAFICLALKLERSPELMASPDLAWRFLPPKPNFSFFF